MQLFSQRLRLYNKELPEKPVIFQQIERFLRIERIYLDKNVKIAYNIIAIFCGFLIMKGNA
jgi:hypothetical protein